jgi:hypothetical protein
MDAGFFRREKIRQEHYGYQIVSKGLDGGHLSIFARDRSATKCLWVVHIISCLGTNGYPFLRLPRTGRKFPARQHLMNLEIGKLLNHQKEMLFTGGFNQKIRGHIAMRCRGRGSS